MTTLNNFLFRRIDWALMKDYQQYNGWVKIWMNPQDPFSGEYDTIQFSGIVRPIILKQFQNTVSGTPEATIISEGFILSIIFPDATTLNDAISNIESSYPSV